MHSNQHSTRFFIGKSQTSHKAQHNLMYPKSLMMYFMRKSINFCYIGYALIIWASRIHEQ